MSSVSEAVQALQYGGSRSKYENPPNPEPNWALLAQSRGNPLPLKQAKGAPPNAARKSGERWIQGQRTAWCWLAQYPIPDRHATTSASKASTTFRRSTSISDGVSDSQPWKFKAVRRQRAKQTPSGFLTRVTLGWPWQPISHICSKKVGQSILRPEEWGIKKNYSGSKTKLKHWYHFCFYRNILRWWVGQKMNQNMFFLSGNGGIKML